MTKDYCQGIEYKDGKVEAVYGQEGRLTAVYDQYGVTLTRFRAEYWLKDHLGNTRLAFADENHNGTIEVWDDPSTPENEAEITQENHYYPFGMNHEGPWYATIGPINGYQYNGKELNEELDLDWNDFGARWYDASIGRWNAVDPMGESYYPFSGYSYAINNPLKYIDLDGKRLVITFIGKGSVETFRKIFNHMLQGQFEVTFKQVKDSKGNKISGKYEIGIKGKQGGGHIDQLSSGGKAFYKATKEIIDSKSITVDMDVEFSNADYPVADYDNNRIDIEDIDAFPDYHHTKRSQDGPTDGGKLIHELWEQFGKASDGYERGERKGYETNHGLAILQEDEINKNTRLAPRMQRNSVVIQRYRTADGKVTEWITQVKDGKFTVRRSK